MFPFPFYFIADPFLCAAPDSGSDPGKDLVKILDAAIDAGARLAQYRDKNSSRREKYEIAKAMREVSRLRGVTLIINDDIDLASAVGADGVHLGQDDLPIWVARKALGEKAIVGVSTHSLQEAVQAESEGADYIGFGPVFKTQTKESRYPVLGIASIAEVKRRVHVPLYAIGGIRLARLPEIIGAGAEGVAVVSALAGDIRLNVAKWTDFLNKEIARKLDKKG